MHEYAIVQSIIEIAAREAKNADAGKIIEIKLAIGDLSSIIDESVSMYFDIISKGTAAEGARLVFRRIPAVFECTYCGNEFDRPVKSFDCPLCGGPGVLLDAGAGREFYIESLEVDA